MATIEQMGNIPSLSPNEVISSLGLMYVNAIKNGIEFKMLPSVMLWGSMGVGKSQSVRQMGKIIEQQTGKRLNIIDVRLILFNPIDLRGIPTANTDKSLAVWLKPKIFDMNEANDVVNILFLDELSAAPQSVQAAAYQITLDRVIGEHRLPDNCIVIAAGNRTTDKSVAYTMPKALANRLMHLEMRSDYESWNSWAVSKGIHPYVTGFLKFRPSYLNGFDASKNDYAFPTPRTWEMVSNILNTVSSSVSDVYSLIGGLLGSGVAVEFSSWCRCYKDLPSIDDIFIGKCKDVPKGTDVLYALTSSMVDYAKKNKDNMRLIANSISYAELLPPDFSTILLKDYMYIEPDYRSKLLKIPEFSKWISKKGKLLDALNRTR